MNKKRTPVERFVKMTKTLQKTAFIHVFGGIVGYLGTIFISLIYLLGTVGIIKLFKPEVVKIDSLVLYILIGCCAIMSGISTYILQIIEHKNAYKTIGILRNSLYKKLRDLCPAKIETKEKIESIKLLTSDINSLEHVFKNIACPMIVGFLFEVTIFVFLSIFINIYFALFELLFYIIAGVIFPYIEALYMKKEYAVRKTYLDDAGSYFEDTVTGINDVSANDIYDVRYRYSVVKNEQLFYKDKRIHLKESVFNALYVLLLSILIFVSIFLGYLCIKYYGLTPSKIVIGIAAAILSFNNATGLRKVPNEILIVKNSANRILDVLEEKPLVDSITTTNDFEFESLEARGITFEYEGRKILKNVELVVNKGEIVGIYSSKEFVGESTILKLFLRFYDITDGNIFYNNIDIKRINTKSLMDNVSLVSESTYMFSDTILNNIKIARPQATLEEVRHACQLAHIDKFILSLEKGYDTEVKNIKDELSSATKERIGLARAYLSNAQLILLDNVCANADSIGQGLILRSIVDMSKERTFLMLSKKKESLKIASRVYRIKEGEILEEEYNVLLDEEK